MKKRYKPLNQVKEFIGKQTKEVQAEYNIIINKLQFEGRLSMPFGEKVEVGLFAIRVISAGNVRIFYVYGREDKIYGIYGYVKKTNNIPLKELNHARKIVKLLKKEELI